MRISSRRVLLVAVVSGGMLLGGAAPALAQGPDELDLNELTEQLEVPGQEEEEDDALEPVSDLLCELADLELLGECEDEVVTEPVGNRPEKPKPGKEGDDHGDKGGDVGDSGDAPVGGVETGAGGTADDGPGLLLPLSVLGGAALTGGAIVGARRLLGSHVD
jgi:hypothetical protein